MRKLAAPWLLLSLAGCVQPPSPPALDTNPPAPWSPADSRVTLPVRRDLGAELDSLEGRIPASDLSPGWSGRDDDSGWTCTDSDCGTRYRYRWSRTRLETSLEGSAALAATTFSYGLQISHKVGPFWLSRSCGLDGDPAQFRVAARSAIALQPDWKLSSQTAITQLQPLRHCVIDIAGIPIVDITSTIESLLRGKLEDATRSLDGQVAAIDLRTPVEDAWARISQPIALADRAWLVIHPARVSVAPFQGSGRILSTEVEIVARPEVVTADQAPAVDPVALPDLGAASGLKGFQITVDGRVDSEALDSALTSRLVGERISDPKHPHRYLDIVAAHMYGMGGTRAALELTFTGTAKGRIWLVGTPAYDADQRMLVVPDLDFDLASRNYLLQAAGWVEHGKLRDQIRAQATFNVAPLLEQGRAQLAQALNRDLGQGLVLAGTVSKLSIVTIRAAHDGLELRVLAEGDARIQPE